MITTTRRNFLKVSVAIPAVMLIKGCGGSNNSSPNSSSVSLSDVSALPTSTDTVLPIPHEINPSLVAGKKVFNLNIQTGVHQFFKDTNTSTYCVNEANSSALTYLAPTLRIKNGEQVEINFSNNLTESTTMHGHGMHVPAIMDGGVHQEIMPGQTWSAQYTVKQKACTNWYHPHFMGNTAQQTYKGLAGLIIIDDNESEALDLPKTYGVDDIPLIVQDRVFDASGALDYSPSRMEIRHGYMGDTFLVNGKISPILTVEAKQIRFRILNGSNARIYNFSFGAKNFTQIATDNAFLANGVRLSSLKLSPAERAEIVLDLTAETGNTFTLTNGSTTLMTIKVTALTKAITTMPAVLTTTLTKFNNPTNTRTFTLGRSAGMNGKFTINGVSMDKNTTNERVKKGVVEVWEVVNPMNMAHNFHIHATHFWIIERNGSTSSVPANEQGYKDTVLLEAGSRVKFVVKMTDYTNSKIPYMYHCHILEHEDDGMMGQFTVVD